MVTRHWLLLLIAAILLSACEIQFPGIPTPTALPTIDISWAYKPVPTWDFTSTLQAADIQSPLPLDFFKPGRNRYPYDFGRTITLYIPVYNPNAPNPFTVDLRSYDLSSWDLRTYLDNSLKYAVFDDLTKWPPADKLPAGFDWQRTRELGMNPGLGVRSLHARGITGRGVGIAVIDAELMPDHQEYASQLRWYEETQDLYQWDWFAPIHGSAIASIAVGETVGVAPEADLYYIGTCLGITYDSETQDYSYLARAISHILEINQRLSGGHKIRVISTQFQGWKPSSKGYAELKAALQEAKDAGLLVVSINLEETYNVKINGLGRDSLSDPDDFSSYRPAVMWEKDFYDGTQPSNSLLVPIDSRTFASPTGISEYTYSSIGGLSFGIPYIAGMYALAVQVDPTITPEKFLALAMRTGRTIQVQNNGQSLPLGPILDPVALIEAIK
jgi:hypothetical protein